VYDGFYVFYFIAHCWATVNALRALSSSHIMTNKDDDGDDDEVNLHNDAVILTHRVYLDNS